MGSSGSSGSSTTTNVDKDYNRRIANIAEAQQRMAEEMQGYYREYGLPLDVMTSQAQMDVLPYETAAYIGQLQGQQELAPYQAGLAKDQLIAQRELLPQQQEATSKFLSSAIDGVDPNRWASQAAADVAQGFSGARGAFARDAGRMGMNVGSERFTHGLADMHKQEALSGAAAQTQARRTADDESYKRLQTASGLGLGG